MNLLRRIQLRTTLVEIFGRDISSILFTYLFGDCCICNHKVLKFYSCQSCNKCFCKDCFNNLTIYYHPIFDYLEFCSSCIINSILNDN